MNNLAEGAIRAKTVLGTAPFFLSRIALGWRINYSARLDVSSRHSLPPSA